MDTLDFLIRLALSITGSMLVIFTIMTAIRTFVLPRGENAWLSRLVFKIVYNLFLLVAFPARTYEERDRVLALFAPMVLLILPIVYLALITLGYTPIYWALDPDPLTFESFLQAFHLSGSSLFTLGYAPVETENVAMLIVSFSDAALGMILVALLIAYLPTIYSAFSQREKLVAMLEVRAGSPPSGVTLLQRVYRNNGKGEALNEVWARWEEWFAEIEETHTSLVALVFFRSPMPDRHWLTAGGAVLDAAALYDAVVDEPRSTASVMMIRAGYVSLRRIADYFGRIEYDPTPTPDDPISVMREEFDEAYDDLKAAGVPVIEDREAAWRNYSGWRVNYDRVLVELARLTSAPYAPWSSDRSLPDMRKSPGIMPGWNSVGNKPTYEKKQKRGA